jgi:hypothetical protein
MLMDRWWTFADWEIVLSPLTPLAVALLIFALEKRGPFTPAQSPRDPGKRWPVHRGLRVLPRDHRGFRHAVRASARQRAGPAGP